MGIMTDGLRQGISLGYLSIYLSIHPIYDGGREIDKDTIICEENVNIGLDAFCEPF